MSSFVFDPNKDLQEQLRSSLHVQMASLMRPNFQKSTHTTSPTTMIHSGAEKKRRRNSFVPTTPQEFRQENGLVRTKEKEEKKHDNNYRHRRGSLVVNVSKEMIRSSNDGGSSPRSSRSTPPTPKVFARLSDPTQFSGIYRRRALNSDGTPTTNKNMNQFSCKAMSLINQQGRSVVFSACVRLELCFVVHASVAVWCSLTFDFCCIFDMHIYF